MAQLFHPAMNTVSRLILIGGPVISIVLGVAMAYAGSWSDWATYRQHAFTQPVPFSHEHHVKGLGIDCRYCHTSVEESSYAGIPPTKTCMTCHSQIWLHAPMLDPVRKSWTTGVPIRWNRVNDLPDYVYFDHSIHVNKGIGCSTCHGDVASMPLMQRVVNLQMRWCIDCHRDPAKHLRPLDQIYNTTWKEPADQREKGALLMAQYHIQQHQLTNCSVCHR
ncbi:MAG: cytochrome c3 family protein [Phycisphaerae bacterium]